MSLPIDMSLTLLPGDIQRVANQPGYTKIGTVKRVIAMAGLPSVAVVDFDDETGVETKLMNGNGTPTYPGQLVRAERQGGVIDSTWQIIEVLTGQAISFGEQVNAILPTPTIPGASSGGIYSKSATATSDNKNAIADPNAPVKARVYIYPRIILPGFYSVYQARAHAIRVQTRELGQTDWADASADIPIVPATILRGTINGDINATATSIAITIPTDRVAEVPTGQPVYWRIGAEQILASAVNDGSGVFTLTVVTHDGVGDASLGDGFGASTAGRGVQSTTAESHTAGEFIMLLSCAIAPADLRPDTEYELRCAFVNSSAQAGPWSNIVGFTSWQQPVPPAAVENLTVEQVGESLFVHWDRVLEDANGDPMSDVRRYIVARAAAALTVTFTLAQVLSAGATLIGDDINATAVPIPATKGFGNFIGVAAVSSNNLLSEWVWEEDDLAPPYPDPSEVTFNSIPRGVLVNIPASADSRNAQTGATVATPSHLDQGFREFWLWQADDSSGTDAVVVNTFTALSNPWYRASGLTGWFKVTAADGAGNSNGPSTYPAGVTKAGETNPNDANWSSGWQFCASLFAESSLPPNGNLQEPNSTNTDAFGWTWAPTLTGSGGSPSLAVTYENTGGLQGNRSYKAIMVESATAGLGPTLMNSIKMPIPAHTTGVVAELWIYSTLAMSVTLTVQYNPANSAGTSLSPFSDTSAPIAIAANTWTKLELSRGTIYGGAAGSVESSAWFTVLPVSPAARSYTWYLDAVLLKFT